MALNKLTWGIIWLKFISNIAATRKEDGGKDLWRGVQEVRQGLEEVLFDINYEGWSPGN